MPSHNFHPRHLPLAAALLLPWCAGPALADRPLVSETADVIDAGECEIETGVLRTKARGMGRATAVELLGACNVAGHSQLGLGLARQRQDGASDWSLGLGGKTLLRAAQDGAPGYALAYGIRSDKAHGGSWRLGGAQLFGVASQALGWGLLGHLNLGWNRSHTDRLNSTTWSVGIESERGLRWAADVYGDDRARPWLSGGLLLPLGDKFSAHVAYAQQFERPRVRLWTLGVKFEL